MLYDDDAQLEVRHVVSLAHHDVDIYGGEEVLPEGELFVKRNCMRLTANKSSEYLASQPKPYYLFTDDCSMKEDFYTALLRCKEAQTDNDASQARTLMFQSAHLVKLIQQLHESEQSLQTRWLNALTGRLFLGIYRTKAIEQVIRTKLCRKISRVQKPAFLGDVEVQEIDMGDCIPIFTSLKLKELTLDGTLTLEADVKYTGNFRLQVATVARLDLGPRFKVREVRLLLAGILKELEGHLLLKIKPPPSNRIWISFETMPKMNISVEPTVSTRHITYGIILRIIENRVREVVNETMVLPNWDDTPFFDTSECEYRGGIFQENVNLTSVEDHSEKGAKVAKELSELKSDYDRDSSNEIASSLVEDEKIDGSATTDTVPDRASHTRSFLSVDEAGKLYEPSSPNPEITAAKPKVLRSRSFVSSSMPVVDIDAASAQAIKEQSPKGKADAAATMKEISSRARPLSPQIPYPESPVAGPGSISISSKDSTFPGSESQNHVDSPSQSSFIQSSASTSQPGSQPSTPGYREPSIAGSAKSEPSSLSSIRERDAGKSPARLSASSDKMHILNQSLNVASSTARKWGLGMLNRHQASESSNNVAVGEAAPGGLRSVTRSEPFGRGQPLPPPGTPLPFPPGHEKSKSAWPSMSLPTSSLNISGMTRRKAMPSPSSFAKPGQQSSSSSISVKSAPQPKRDERLSRENSDKNAKAAGSRQSDEVLVIAAPTTETSSHGTSVKKDDNGSSSDHSTEGEARNKNMKHNKNKNSSKHDDIDNDDNNDNDSNGNYDNDNDDSDNMKNRPALPMRTSNTATAGTTKQGSGTNSSVGARKTEGERSNGNSKPLSVKEGTPSRKKGSRKSKIAVRSGGGESDGSSSNVAHSRVKNDLKPSETADADADADAVGDDDGVGDDDPNTNAGASADAEVGVARNVKNNSSTDKKRTKLPSAPSTPGTMEKASDRDSLRVLEGMVGS